MRSLVAPSPRPLFLRPEPLFIEAAPVLVPTITVAEPLGVSPLFVTTSILISAPVTAAFGIAVAKLFTPARFGVATALIVDRPVSVLLPRLRTLAWGDLLLQQAPDIPQVLCQCRPGQH